MRFWIAGAGDGEWSGAGLAQLHPTGRAVVAQAVEEVIRPGFDAYQTRTQALVASAGSDCACLGGAARGAAGPVQGDGGGVVTGGALPRSGRCWKRTAATGSLFWPDRKGIALKQVQAILASEDASATRSADSAGKERRGAGAGGAGVCFVRDGFGRDGDGCCGVPLRLCRGDCQAAGRRRRRNWWTPGRTRAGFRPG